MASRKFNPTNGKALIYFRYGGRQFNRTISAKSDREAERACALIEETIQDLERGKLSMPPAADPAAFILSGGKLAARPQLVSNSLQEAPKPPGLKEIMDSYAATLTPGSKETNSLGTEAVHRRHLVRHLGESCTFDSMGVDAIQGYVDGRVRDGVGRETIRKELSTLRVIWGWAYKRKHIPSALLWMMKDLTFPKSQERPPFLTWDQIRRKVERGGMTAEAVAELWECLWLNQEQTTECLAWVKDHGSHPFVYPMFVFAAYTGARRGEMLRCEWDDWDFEAGYVTIRQKKADKTKSFTRRTVPIHPFLKEVMSSWMTTCPSSKWALCMPDGRLVIPQTASESLRTTLRSGKWSVLHGWHTFRHSLASNMASSGVDQRVINDILGHHTEEMERRYRHLLPQTKQHALHSLFKAGSGR